MDTTFDFIVIGAGSAGCAVAAGLAKANIGTVCVLEAGPTDAVPQVKIPFGLLYTMGSGRDWCFKSTEQNQLNKRSISVNRGRMVGGSSSINSMVWFRGRRDDFDQWQVPGWTAAELETEFEEVESHIQPARLPYPHPLSESFGQALSNNPSEAPSPEIESSGVFHTNMRRGRRWSAADAFLRPAIATGRVQLLRGSSVNRLVIEQSRATAVKLSDGRLIRARSRVVLSAGSIGSPAILMRSGIGPAYQLQDLGIPVVVDSPSTGQNLHDHPAVGLHFSGKNSGYGLVLNQALPWIISPLQWMLFRRGRMSSNFVEAGAFFRAQPALRDDDNTPDVQVHFIPYMMGYRGNRFTRGSGYFADVCVCRPRSRGCLTLTSPDPHVSPAIDLGLLKDEHDLQTLVTGLKRLRAIMQQAPLGKRRGTEVFPGSTVCRDEQLEQYARNHVATAYHPVGTLAMGGDNTAPVAPNLQLRGTANVWIADASIMPRITSANTNAPSMMIGHKAAKLIVESLSRNL